MVNLNDLNRFPVNTRGYVVVPCISLTYENMNDSLIGYKVTVGLCDDAYGTTDSGIITGFDVEKIHIKIGSKVKKFNYDSKTIQLQVYQFDKKVMFSNDQVSENELADTHKDFYGESDTPEDIQPKRKESEDVKIPPQQKEEKKTKKKVSGGEVQPKKSSSSYTPKYGIEWS